MDDWRKKYDDTKAEIFGMLNEAGIEMEAAYVPSTYNASSKEWQGIKWKIKFKSSRGSFETDYTQGIGHLPAPLYTPRMAGRVTLFEEERIDKTLRTGRLSGVYGQGKPLEKPSIVDVVGCLISDRSAADAASFEEWAGDLGYDADSRKAEGIYQACLKIALDLNRVFGAALVEKLMPLAQEL